VVGAFFRSIDRFRQEERGVVLILVALLIVPLLLVIAVGIDFSQSLIVKRQLAAAVDAAALAIGTDKDEEDQVRLDEKAEAYIKAHYPNSSIGELKEFRVTRVTNADSDIEVDVSAVADVPTSFMRLGGVDKLTVGVSSKVVRRDRKLEVVMVLDNSGSMAIGGKMQAMKDAANGLVNTLYGDQATSDNIRIGLVPFTGAVNVNVPSTTTWLDRTNPADLNGLLLTLLAGESAFDFLAVMQGGIAARWGGCVRSRMGYDIVDTPPNPLSNNTLFSAHFKPFLGPLRPIYIGAAPFGGLFGQPQNENCPAATAQPLTNTKSSINQAINAMTANGSTNIPEGIAWGWRLISPTEPFTQGAAYSDNKSSKALIVLTDGENSVAGQNTFSSYGYGRSDNPQLGPNVNATLNTKTTEVCNNVKGASTTGGGIRVYTVAFDVPAGSTVENLLRSCASTDSFYQSQSNSELQAAFRDIAASLTQLRIAQ
jgi:Flp pilus assembly protein TadG